MEKEKKLLYISILLAIMGLIFFGLTLFEVIAEDNPVRYFSLLVFTPHYIFIIKYLFVLFKKDKAIVSLPTKTITENGEFFLNIKSKDWEYPDNWDSRKEQKTNLGLKSKKEDRY